MPRRPRLTAHISFLSVAALALLSGCASVHTVDRPGSGLHVEWLDFEGDTDRKVAVSYIGWAGTSPDEALERVVEAACQAGLDKGVAADRPYLWVTEHATDSTFVAVPVGPQATRQRESYVSAGGVVTSRFVGPEPSPQRVVTRQAGAASLMAVLVPQDAVDAGLTRGPGLTYIDSRTCTFVPKPPIGG